MRQRIEYSFKSSAEPAVKRTPVNLTAVAPMFFVCAEFGSNVEMFVVTEPTISELFIVCVAPTIGSEPATGAVVLTPVTVMLATSPLFGRFTVLAMLPATVKVWEAPAGIDHVPPTVAMWFESNVCVLPT